MRRGQLNANDWKDLKDAKIVFASLNDLVTLDVDQTLSEAIDEAVEELGRAGRDQKTYVILAISQEEETEGARSGHEKRGE